MAMLILNIQNDIRLPTFLLHAFEIAWNSILAPKYHIHIWCDYFKSES